jgi:hypothetical protein
LLGWTSIELKTQRHLTLLAGERLCQPVRHGLSPIFFYEITVAVGNNPFIHDTHSMPFCLDP